MARVKPRNLVGKRSSKLERRRRWSRVNHAIRQLSAILDEGLLEHLNTNAIHLRMVFKDSPLPPIVVSSGERQ